VLGRLRLLAGDRVTACVGAGRAVSDLPVGIGGRSLICVAVLSRRVRGALPVHVAVGIFRDRAAALHRAVFTGGLKRALVRNTAAGVFLRGALAERSMLSRYFSSAGLPPRV